MPDAGDEAANAAVREALIDLKEIGRAAWRAGMHDVEIGLPGGRRGPADRGRDGEGPQPEGRAARAPRASPTGERAGRERVVRREVANEGEARQLSSALRGAGIPFASYERPDGARAFVMKETDLAEGWRRIAADDPGNMPATTRQMAFIASLQSRGAISREEVEALGPKPTFSAANRLLNKHADQGYRLDVAPGRRTSPAPRRRRAGETPAEVVARARSSVPDAQRQPRPTRERRR